MGPHGRYSVQAKIADGGMAEIFLATLHGAAGFSRPVVLKRVRSSLAADAGFRQSLLDEAAIAMRLQHSNIVQVLDLGEAAGSTFLVLELVEGWSLAQLLRRAAEAKHPLPPSLAVFLTIEMCRGLAYAHGRREGGRSLEIVHRDVSPQNLLISVEGEVKLTDFGIARARTREGQTGIGQVKGKPSFMSPEQVRNEPLDARSDLFAVGTMLYQMLTGELPFKGATDLDTMLRVRDAKHVALSKRMPELPRALARVVGRLLKKDRDDRYDSADEVVVALEKVQREALEPAGSTELKQYLAALARKDNQLPLTATVRPPPLPQGEASGSAEWIELSDVHLVASGPAPAQPLPPPLPRARRLWPYVVLAPLLGAAGWWALGHPGVPAPLPQQLAPEPPPPAPVAMAPDASTDLEADAGAPVAVAPPAPPVLDDAGSLADAGLPEETSDAGLPATSDAGQEALATELDAEPAEPEPTPAAPAPPAADAGREPAAAPVRPPASPGSPKVTPPADGDWTSVQFITEPPGATLKVGRRALGVTPGTFRFRPGILFEVVLEKPGRQSVTRRFTSRSGPGQVVRVTLPWK
ncbi:MAG: protein kinase [Myxococcaceae bacterium]|nr:protein kinase [Myxococcaceae bacterium]